MQHVFIDESGTTTGKYTVVGSLWGHNEALKRLEDATAPVLDIYFPNRRELKWKKISTAKLAGYLGIVDAFALTPGCRFRCLVLDRSKLDYRAFNSGDEELGYYKFVYQLICKNIQKDRQLFGVEDSYLVFHDTVSSFLRQQTRLSELKDVLNNTSRLYARKIPNPVRDIQSIDSATSLPLQIVDVFTGAVRRAFEFRGTTNVAPLSKQTFIQHVQDTLDLRSLGNATSYSREKFNIWEFKLR